MSLVSLYLSVMYVSTSLSILQSLPLSLGILVGRIACTAVILTLCRHSGVRQQHTQLYQVTVSTTDAHSYVIYYDFSTEVNGGNSVMY